jgi:hypothetical protein
MLSLDAQLSKAAKSGRFSKVRRLLDLDHRLHQASKSPETGVQKRNSETARGSIVPCTPLREGAI